MLGIGSKFKSLKSCLHEDNLFTPLIILMTLFCNLKMVLLKKNKPWFDERCSKLLYQRIQAKMQWSQRPSVINRDNLNNVRREASRHFRNKKREYLKDKISKLAMTSRKKNIRDLRP
jgi:hypothetical protein